jgi:hypothetical protein
MSLDRRTVLKAAAAAPFLLRPAPASPQGRPLDQFVLVDALHTHTLETKGFSYFALPADVPDNWKAPLDFAGGSIHLRLEVIAKPSDRPVNLQLCVFQDRHSSDKHA